MTVILIVIAILILVLKYQAVYILGFDSKVVDWVCLALIVAICFTAIFIVNWDEEE